ncbi:hypothetical protein PA7_10540 [Pseudonocardia asaccharolytica DSM 44247 = NBRC 16224]|uniref:SnoaL-like domain-containing protein n=2 Tax=Pseudonocardia asaccharolytica TaxID=54010 RepID=A0A511CXL2_9PSEU|nr:hypothetical protein PA7_10540 [Pseudonocardia asaccharolytica DSM 44247 = NBRC 16224]
MAVKTINGQDMEGALSFYEPTATFVAQDGKRYVGREAVREALSEYFAIQPTLTVTAVRKVVESEEIALVAGDWTLTGTAPDGSPIEMNATNIDVVRRQTEGHWLIVIDNPFGLE